MPINLRERERAAIIDAAYRCVAEAGDEPVRMSTILANAGVSSRAFYRHFSSKDDLLLALVAQECDLLAADLDRIADRDTDSPADQLAAWLATMFEVSPEPRHRLRFAALDSDEVRAAAGYRDVRERCFAARERSLARILTRGRLEGSLPSTDPEIDAMAISALVSRVLVGQRTVDAEAFTRARIQVTEFASRAVGAWLPMKSEVASSLRN
ncbi:TetR/AcrR family transcriptional regulator [Mycobacterium sp. pV006]|uniref:TetR/AcrR family transcriptional regulator n=1 Tax=Mycobacterium sp. pV006 TaxID=3238983 RepID=UPI00351AE38E